MLSANNALDEQARQTALDTQQSFIVQAPAGSGKTSLLINRYLNLLAKAHAPESILVMTFTNKAVDELVQRISDILRTAKTTQAINSHQQQTQQLALTVLARSDQLNWQLLTQLDRLNIKTIDGLSAQLVMMQNLVAQLTPSRIVASNYQRNQLYKQAVINVLSHIDDEDYQDNIRQVLAYLDNKTDKFIGLFSHMLAQRDQWLSQVGHSGLEQIQKTATHIIRQSLEGLARLLAQDKYQAFIALAVQSPKLDSQACAFFTQYQSKKTVVIEPKDLAFFQQLAAACLTKAGIWTKRTALGFTKANYRTQSEQLAQLDMSNSAATLIEALGQLSNLPCTELSLQEKQIIPQIVALLKLSTAQLMVDFAQYQAVDFVAIATQAVQLLQADDTPSEVALYLDYQLEHILMDEFQDTSQTQFELLKSLIKHWQPNQEKTLFLVGDPMQSIYRFRQAEVGLFLQVWSKGIGQLSLQGLNLTQNFRSSQAVIAENNQLFTQIFPTTQEAKTGAIPYHSSQVPADKSSHEIVVPAIEFFAFDDKSDSPKQTHYEQMHHEQMHHEQTHNQETQKVVALVQKQQAQHPNQTIAILVRARTHLADIMPALRQAGIEFSAPNILPLNKNKQAQDLVSLCRALLHLGDKLAWLSIVRAPWCGLNLADILLLSDKKYLTVWQAICQTIKDDTSTQNNNLISQQGLNAITTLHAVLSPIIAQRGRFELSQILAVILHQLEVNDYLTLVELEAQNTILALIASMEDASSGFDIDTLESMIAENFETTTTQCPVQLMTIYNAKGLEFDCVILPKLAKPPRNTDLTILPMAQLAEGLLFSPIKSNTQKQQNSNYQYLSQLQKLQSNHELTRLLYVAMTRAKSKIYLLGHKKQAKKKPRSGTLLFLLWDQYQLYFEQLEPLNPLQQQNSLATITNTNPTPAKIFPPLLRQTAIKTPIPSHPPTGEFVQLDNTLTRQYQASIGTLIHRYLEHHQLKNTLIPDKKVLTSHLGSLGLPNQQLALAITQIQVQLSHLLKADFYPWLFANRDSTQVELALFFNKTGTAKTQKIILDRVFIAKGVLHIIDYKTNQLQPGENETAFLARMQLEYQAQMQQYAKIAKQYYTTPIKTQLCLLAIGQLLEIPAG